MMMLKKRRKTRVEKQYHVFLFLSLILFLLIEGERARVHAKLIFVGFSHFSSEQMCDFILSNLLHQFIQLSSSYYRHLSRLCVCVCLLTLRWHFEITYTFVTFHYVIKKLFSSEKCYHYHYSKYKPFLIDYNFNLCAKLKL